MSQIKSLKQDILTECEDDHIGLWSVVRDIEEAFPKLDQGALRDQALRILHDLLQAREIEAGIPTADGDFRALPLNPQEIITQIEKDWPADRRPTIGEGLWFSRARRADSASMANR